MTATGHGLGLVSKSVVGDYNVLVSGRDQRFDHYNFVRYGIEGISPQAV